jgi:hypothetical protein
MGERARAGELLGEQIAHLRDELDAMAARGLLPPELKALRGELDALPTRAGTRAEGSA